jgi:hypothetical protein
MSSAAVHFHEHISLEFSLVVVLFCPLHALVQGAILFLWKRLFPIEMPRNILDMPNISYLRKALCD